MATSDITKKLIRYIKKDCDGKASLCLKPPTKILKFGPECAWEDIFDAFQDGVLGDLHICKALEHNDEDIEIFINEEGINAE